MATSDREREAISGSGPDATGLEIAMAGALAPGEADRTSDAAGLRGCGRPPRVQAKRVPKISLILADPAPVGVARKTQNPSLPADQRSARGDKTSTRRLRATRSGDKSDLNRQARGTRQRQTALSALVSKTVPTDQLHSSWLRPRTPYDERAIRTLAASVRTCGWQHPILVRPHPVIARDYEIVVGELPFQAARSAGLECLSVVVCSLSDFRALECVLLEDVQRPDLAPFEVAVGYGQLIRTFNYSLADLAKLVGKSERQAARLLLLLDSPKAAREAPGGQEVKPDQVRPSGDASDGAGLDVKAPAGGTTSRRALENPDRGDSAGGPEDPEGLSLNAEMAALERHLSSALGLKVEMMTNGRQGAVQISFANIGQLAWILRHLSSFGIHSEAGPSCPGLAA